MKRNVLEFLRRGMSAMGLGPLVLAAVYLALGTETLAASEVVLGIVSLSALAFIAGGVNVVYQIERLPLAAAILIHGAALYAAYLVTYLVNGWLADGVTPLVIFTAVFVVGYLLIWAGIYLATRRKTEKLNKALQKQNK